MERRKNPRVNRTLKAQYFLEDDIGVINVEVKNISVGGMKVLNPFPIDNRYRFPMRIFLTSELYIDVVCRVIWKLQCKEKRGYYDMGLEFVDIKEKDRELLKTLIQQWLKTYE